MSGGRARSVRPETVAVGALLAGSALFPWVAFLAFRLPAQHEAHHWRLTWLGFDALLIVGFLTVAWAGLRRSWWFREVATATATALLVDAWFDVSTARSGHELLVALVLALSAELPLAGVLGLAAVTARTGVEQPQRRSGRRPAPTHLRLVHGDRATERF